MTAPSLVLASASPRRAQLLRQIGLVPTIDPAAIDESVPRGMGPTEAVLHLARQKAAVVAERHAGRDVVVLGADTVVCLEDEVLGKPADAGEAMSMLDQLSGRTHEVHTGVQVVSITSGQQRSSVATTRVTMRPLDREEIAAYVATGEPADAAGAYAIQGRAAVFVEHIEGDYANVVGLPLARVASLLGELGMAVPDGWTNP
jgi:septum formation protein